MDKQLNLRRGETPPSFSGMHIYHGLDIHCVHGTKPRALVLTLYTEVVAVI